MLPLTEMVEKAEIWALAYISSSQNFTTRRVQTRFIKRVPRSWLEWRNRLSSYYFAEFAIYKQSEGTIPIQ